MKTRNLILLFAAALMMLASGCKKENPNSSSNSVTDCQGYTYPTVTIGNQTWMAENLRCTKYDTESEQAGATLNDYDLPTLKPYCVKAYKKDTWDEGDGGDNESNSKVTGKELSDEQISKLGCLYNWSAALGLTNLTEIEKQSTNFSKQRQGICPNGWHIPTAKEWDELAEALGGVINEDDDTYTKIGNKLKSASGWYDGGDGSNSSSMSILPSGQNGERGKAYMIGINADLCCATPSNKYNDFIYSYNLNYSTNNFGKTNEAVSKEMATAVRCVKN